MKSIGELVPGVVADLERRRTHPLVELEEGGHFIFHDYASGGTYDFKPRDAGDCLRWIAHLLGKSWVTADHIEQFSNMAARHFGVPRR